jgi:hypothetical protein
MLQVLLFVLGEYTAVNNHDVSQVPHGKFGAAVQGEMPDVRGLLYSGTQKLQGAP